MPYPIGLRPYENGAPAFPRISLMTRWSWGLPPRPPSPSGNCTHARPASNWAPRKSAAVLSAGGWSTSSFSVRSTTSSSVMLMTSKRNLTGRSRRRRRALPQHNRARFGLVQNLGQQAVVEAGQGGERGHETALIRGVVGDDAASLATAVEDEADPSVPRAAGKGRGPDLEELVPADLLVETVREPAPDIPVV